MTRIIIYFRSAVAALTVALGITWA